MKNIRSRIMSYPFSLKMVLFFYGACTILAVVLTLVLIWIAKGYTQQQMIESDMSKILYGNLMIEKEQRYMYGLADYYSLSGDVQTMLHASNAGREVPMPEDLIRIAHAQMYAVSLVFYNLQGGAVSYMSIDASSNPVDQLQNVSEERPFQRLLFENKTYEWEFIDEKDTVYMQRDNSPKIALWRIIQDTKSFRTIGALCLALDTRKLLSTASSFEDLYYQLIVLDAKGEEVFNRSSIDCALRRGPAAPERVDCSAYGRQLSGAAERQILPRRVPPDSGHGNENAAAERRCQPGCVSPELSADLAVDPSAVHRAAVPADPAIFPHADPAAEKPVQIDAALCGRSRGCAHPFSL